MESSNSKDAWVPSYCYQCNSGPCSFRVRVLNGVAVNIEPNPALESYLPTGARICVKAYGLIQKLYNPHRIKTPLKRTNPQKGRGIDPKWAEISWKEALETLTGKLKEIRRKGLVDEKGFPRLAVTTGADGSPLAYQGTLDAFMAAWGPVDDSLMAGSGIKCRQVEHICGELWHKAFINCPDTPHCKYVISLGANTNASGGVPGVWRHAQARVRGMKWVQIEPHLSVTGATADEWIPIRPKTDAALLCAMVHVVLHELDWRKVCDLGFLKSMTNSPYLVGADGYFVRDANSGKPLVWDADAQQARTYDADDIRDYALEGTYLTNGVEARPAFHLLREHVAEYTPAWASRIADVKEETIRRLAKEFVANAMVGASIEIDGMKLPLRPVAIIIGKSTNAGPGAYLACWAQHVLQILVGALEVPGSMLGFHVRYSGPVQVGPDGFMDYPIAPTDPEHWRWPAQKRSGGDVKSPLSHVHASGHLAWLNLKSPPSNWPATSPPDVWITHRTNPALSMWDTETVLEGIKKIPFHVSFGYTHDETNEFADLILPESMDLEALQLLPLGPVKMWERHWENVALLVRQPVVKPLYDTLDMTDILSELAERVGILKEYNECINEGKVLNLPLRTAYGDYSLDPTKRHSGEEIWDRLCRSATISMTGGKQETGLEGIKERGAVVIPFPHKMSEGIEIGPIFRPFRPWYLHPTMIRKKLRYNLPWQERIKSVGMALGQRLHEQGIHWWDRQIDAYEALPGWRDFPALYDTGPQYDLWLVTTRSMQYSWGANAGIPAMAEVARHVLGHAGVMINSTSARARGIKDGDQIWIESPLGKVRARAILRQGVHPEVVVTTQQFGHWRTPFAKDLGWPNMNPLTPIRYELTDEHGVGSDHVKVKVYKA